MSWLALVCCLFAGVFLANAVPHVVSGMMGRPFPSPFAKPPGEGLSSSTVNVLWGFVNLGIGYALCRAGSLDWGNIAEVAAFGAGGLIISLLLARHFGQFNGGNAPQR